MISNIFEKKYIKYKFKYNNLVKILKGGFRAQPNDYIYELRTKELLGKIIKKVEGSDNWLVENEVKGSLLVPMGDEDKGWIVGEPPITGAPAKDQKHRSRGKRGGNEKTRRKITNFNLYLNIYNDNFMNPKFMHLENQCVLHQNNIESCNKDKNCIFRRDKCQSLKGTTLDRDLSYEEEQANCEARGKNILACNSTEKCIYRRDKCQYLEIKPKEKDLTNGEDCSDLYGLSQTSATCWFDSLVMALTTDSKMREIWGPYLFSRYTYTLNQLNYPNPPLQNFSMRKETLSKIRPLLEKLGRVSGKSGPLSQKLLDTPFFESKLLNYWLDDFNDCIKWINESLQEKFSNFNLDTFNFYIEGNYQKSIVEITNSNIGAFRNSRLEFFGKKFVKLNYIPVHGRVKRIKNLEKNKLIMFTNKSNISSLPPVLLKITDDKNKIYNYDLKSITISGFGHVIAYLKCDNEWFLYDNEISKRKNKLVKVDFNKITINSEEYYLALEQIAQNHGQVSINEAPYITYFYHKE